MSVVCDASVLVKVLILESDTHLAETILASQHVFVPELVYPEVGNAVWAHMRSMGVDLSTSQTLLEKLGNLRLEVRAVRPHIRRAFAIAYHLGHPIYDCVYLALAEDLGIPFVTADQRLLSAVRRASLASIEVKALRDFA